MYAEAVHRGSDDELLEKYLEGEELTIDELWSLRDMRPRPRYAHGHVRRTVHHIGTTELLGRLIRYMPDASQKVMMGTDKKTGEPVMVYPNKPFTGFVFKTLIDPFAGKLIELRPHFLR